MPSHHLTCAAESVTRLRILAGGALLATAIAAGGVASPAWAASGDILAPGTQYCADSYDGHGGGSRPDAWAVDINFPGDAGAPLFAPGAGSITVKNVEGGPSDDGISGNAIIWTSSDGTEQIYLGHLASFGKTGAVSSGTKVGAIGKTGAADGEHVHVYRNLDGSPAPVILSGVTINPTMNPAVYGAWPCNGTTYTSRGAARAGNSGADFDGNGKSDILWYGPGDRKDAMWLATGGGGFKSVSKTVKGTYTPVPGDFDGNGKSDILWYGPGDRKDAMWLATGGGGFKSVSKTVKGTYTPVPGDFDGNGKSDILWYGPGDRKDAMWLATGSGGFKSVSKTVKGTYTPVPGDFDGNGKSDILWYGPGDRKDAMWLATGSGGFKSVSKTVKGTYTPVPGDFDGNGKSDILWYGPGDRKDAMWLATGGGGFKSVSKTVKGTYTPIPSA